MPTSRDIPIIPVVVQQHAEETAFLHSLRTSLLHVPHVGLRHIARFDERLAAHLDGLSVAGDRAWPFCEAGLASASSGALFTMTVRSIQEKELARIDRCFALAEAVPKARSGLLSAFGWLPRPLLRGIVVGFLTSNNPFRRAVGIAACAMHRVDPALLSAGRLQDPEPPVRARALRTAGEIACEQVAAECDAAIRDEHPDCRFWGAWSSALLGSRAAALDVLGAVGIADGPHRGRAFRLSAQAMDVARAHGWLREIAQGVGRTRWLIEGAGIVGDPAYVPWLIARMADLTTARVAAEAFTLITGADLESLQLERTRPEDFDAGPTDNPDDPNVDLDPDDELPWPDPGKVEKWWRGNGGTFTKGVRYFMGAPVTRPHCTAVLKNGNQRHRVLAAHHLCLLDPGTPLFNTSAPAWRQQRLLAEL